MSRELDAEIATLDGWTLRRVGGPMRFVGRPPGVEPDQPWQPVPRYSSDLNALMVLIDKRWGENYQITIAGTGWVNLVIFGRGEYDGYEGTDHTERLARTVVAALRAEAEE